MTDLSRGLNPESISVHLFTNSIPVDRTTENRAEYSSSRIYAVFKTFLSLSEMTTADGSPLEMVFVSIRCGASSSRFKLLGEHVTAHLYDDHSVRGEVCAGNWVFHYIDMPSTANSSATLDVALTAYEGIADFTVLVSHPPVRIAPPYGHAGENVQAADVLICEAEAGERYYIGVQASEASQGCAVYDIIAHIDLGSESSFNCSSERQAAPELDVEPTALAAYVPAQDAVEPDAVRAYSIEIDHAHSHDNLLIEVELTQTKIGVDTPTALEVRLFEGELPTDGQYSSQHFAAAGSSGLWSVTVSAHDLKETTYYVAVKGTANSEVRAA